MRWHAAPSPRRAPSPANGRPTGSQVVIVREGDTLYSLSRRYGVPVAELVAANRIYGGRIEVGQRLIVPARGPSLAQRHN
jgi:LysM repeat protein